MRKNNFLLFLIIFEIIITAYLLFSGTGNSYLCLDNSSCSSVQNSIYGKIFGVKLSLFGSLSFIILLSAYLLMIKGRIKYEKFLFLGIIGLILALYFIYLQIFVLKEICSSCMVIDIGMIMIFFLILWDYRKVKKNFVDGING